MTQPGLEINPGHGDAWLHDDLVVSAADLSCQRSVTPMPVQTALIGSTGWEADPTETGGRSHGRLQFLNGLLRAAARSST